MTLEQARRWRALIGKLAALFIILMFAALFDGLAAQFRQPVNEFGVVAGTTVFINGNLAEGVQDLQDLASASSSADVQVSLTEIRRGFWIGKPLWQGKVEVSPRTPPGEYRVTVGPKWTSDKPPLIFRIIVYKDLLTLQQNSWSIIERQTGVSPWIVSGAFLALAGLALGVVVRLSGQLEKLLAHRGQAEIYKVDHLESGYAIAFGLGTEHGVSPGDQVTVLDPNGNSVGTAQVEKCSTQDSVGFAALDRDIRPGFLVSRN